MKTFTYPQIAVSISGGATSANQAIEIASLQSIDSKTPALGQQLAAASQPVVLTAAQLTTLTPLSSVSVNNFPATQAISAAALPLPSGASTSANQGTGNASLASIDGKVPALGQALATASVPVVLTAAQLTTLTPLTAVTANAGTNLNTSALALDATVAKDGSLTTLNSSVNSLLKPASTLAAVTTVGAVTSITNALPVGANVIGKVSIDQTTPGTTNLVALAANQSVNVAQIAGTVTSTDAGPSGIGAQRVVQANVATATVASVSSLITNQTALAASSTRKGAAFYNNSTSVAYLKWGATASSTSFTIAMAANSYYELPGPNIYSGIIDVIWVTANGTMLVTST